MDKSFVEKVALGVNRYGFPVANITTDHSNYHIKQTADADCVIVEIMELQVPRRNERVRIPHVFGELGWALFSMEKCQINVVIIPFGFLDIKHKGVTSVLDVSNICDFEGLDRETTEARIDDFQNTVQSVLSEFNKEYSEWNEK